VSSEPGISPVQIKDVIAWPTGLANFLKKDSEITPVITEARGQSQASPYGVYDRRSGTEAGFSPNTLGFPTKYHSTNVPFSPLYPYNLSK